MPTLHTLPDGRRVSLARYVEHDDRSRDFPFAETSGGSVRSVDHGVTVILDQGELGSCTGNATIGVLNTATARSSMSVAEGEPFRDEDDAVSVYELATRLDWVPGHYPPSDTGSSGLAAAKAARRLKFYAGAYRHSFSMGGFLRGLMLFPASVGTIWTGGMFTPDARGYVAPAGPDDAEAGGHQYLAYGYDEQQGDVLLANSWGTAWGLDGRFRMRAEVAEDLIVKRRGDVVFLRPSPTGP